MTEQVKRCDVCRAYKGEGNHWGIVLMYPSGALLLALSGKQVPETMETPHWYDVCGAACEQKLIGELRNKALRAPQGEKT